MSGVVWVAQKNDQIDPLSTAVHVPLSPWLFKIEGTGVGEIDGAVPRSGCE